MDDVAIALEHVDLLNGLNRLNIEFLQRSLELLVIGAGALVDLLDLSPGSTLSAEYANPSIVSIDLLEFIL